ncbi:hypothetical protein CVIRNUC_002138 [Coccomyxa viridis]|uniref:Uncharacterized protein n=1 Tax=Coccomyxa viridis TaxID=1274662 RepID=A0AAV1HV34_9CHLO|nr:hypothetical protein CVIRNUC_002138 [Coccomyxa viridis]
MANVTCAGQQGVELFKAQRLASISRVTPIRAPAPRTSSSRHVSRQHQQIVRAERDNGGGFVTGFVVGGAIFGALGFLFAPQISAALLNDEQRLRLPKFLDEEEKSPEATKQDLADKIASLNSAIDDVSAQLKAQDNSAEMAVSSNATTS